jgi:hypothetical protein
MPAGQLGFCRVRLPGWIRRLSNDDTDSHNNHRSYLLWAASARCWISLDCLEVVICESGFWTRRRRLLIPALNLATLSTVFAS